MKMNRAIQNGLIYFTFISLFIIIGCSSNDDDAGNESAMLTTNILFKDADGDGYTDGAIIKSMNRVVGYRSAAELNSFHGDCDDNNADNYPGAPEICEDAVDNNCDGVINEGCANMNSKPVAYPITLKVDTSVSSYHQQLEAYDNDGDTLTFELMSNPNGEGYRDALLDPKTGVLELTIIHDSTTPIVLAYHVTDGLLFSDPAEITIEDGATDADGDYIGELAEDPEAYAIYPGFGLKDHFGFAQFDALPLSVDLSGNFPGPGYQGKQNSCVAWSTAYAVMTYQEKIQYGWSLDTPAHIFSPAFIYNQINFGRDGGAYVTDALDLLVSTGVASLATMPYDEYDYLTQPNAQAMKEAEKYRIKDWRTVLGTQQIKTALTNQVPVIASIKVYEDMFYLYGPHSVYNTNNLTFKFNHSIVLVGYDDNSYGGAFHILNWWGPSWGDGGYFWIPYEFFSRIANSTYVLEDDATASLNKAGSTEPPKSPNLVVAGWKGRYEQRPGGSGEFCWRVTNVGDDVAEMGGDVRFLLSKDKTASADDIVLLDENIHFAMKPGQSVYRDEPHSIRFQFPDNLEDGSFYLICGVDSVKAIAESDEEDNISMGQYPVMIKNGLPDLYPSSWHVEWDKQDGDIWIEYSLTNKGGVATIHRNWDVNLVLSPDNVIGNGDELFVYKEQAAHIVPPGSSVYRDSAARAYFNLFTTVDGKSVPPGYYYMALWVDAENAVIESNEMNNVSLGYSRVAIKSQTAADQGANISSTMEIMYNGIESSSTPLKQSLAQTVEGRQRFLLGNTAPESQLTSGNTIQFDKANTSKNFLIFPEADQIRISSGDK